MKTTPNILEIALSAMYASTARAKADADPLPIKSCYIKKGGDTTDTGSGGENAEVIKDQAAASDSNVQLQQAQDGDTRQVGEDDGTGVASATQKLGSDPNNAAGTETQST